MKTVINPEKEMKDTGIEWVGLIPKNWYIRPLYACLDEINQKNSPIVTMNILSLTNTDGVIPYSERGNQGNKSKENLEDYKVVYPNTIVANSMNILIGSVGLSKYEGCVSPVYYVYSLYELFVSNGTISEKITSVCKWHFGDSFACIIA